MFRDRAQGFFGAAVIVFACVLFSAMTTSAQDELAAAPKPASPAVKTTGKVNVCKEIDSDLNCAEELNEWSVDTPFNLIYASKTPIGVTSLGIVIYRQDDDGMDVEFVIEYQQNVAAASHKFATVDNRERRLPAGRYSVYIIRWDRRETQFHYGNFTDCLAKMTLMVK